MTTSLCIFTVANMIKGFTFAITNSNQGSNSPNFQFALVHYFTKVGSGEYYLEDLEETDCMATKIKNRKNLIESSVRNNNTDIKIVFLLNEFLNMKHNNLMCLFLTEFLY